MGLIVLLFGVPLLFFLLRGFWRIGAGGGEPAAPMAAQAPRWRQRVDRGLGLLFKASLAFTGGILGLMVLMVLLKAILTR